MGNRDLNNDTIESIFSAIKSNYSVRLLTKDVDRVGDAVDIIGIDIGVHKFYFSLVDITRQKIDLFSIDIDINSSYFYDLLKRNNALVVVEEPWMSNNIRSYGNLMRRIGFIDGLLYAIDNDYGRHHILYTVPPSEWQSTLLNISGSSTKQERKKASLDILNHLSNIDIKDHNISDAFCISLYGWYLLEMKI